jgi:hypothetical protein
MGCSALDKINFGAHVLPKAQQYRAINRRTAKELDA